ncbi:MAG: hypothetical protein A2030_10255 [Chloroflexi bacterium RBG_19FT_COMBO_50_10]|nr:MAG: hypothetical protein A2030_10255 [Chloroflexi bacterium RBG_19FT_COMBO_50_10]
MVKKFTFIVTAIVLSMLVLSSCNLPIKGAINSQTPASNINTIINTPTLVPSLCDNLYYPNSTGDTWEYKGNTSATGAYTRTDTISNSGAESFSVQSTTSGVSYTVDYSCTEAGLLVANPIQQYLGAILTSLNGQVNLNLTSNSGISLPAKISPGDSWQQIAEWEGSAQGYSANGKLVFDYTATGFETITAPSGTFDAMRVNTTIRIEISDFRILYGTYGITTWMAPNVGIIKSEGTSNVPNVDFADSLELTRFAPSP